eukprot:NODE_3326_length_2052_cov_9.648831.p1 GENE.NODE_3326_length_2052_cov_9.648831~~NODE_3326_length_2052_cov_9.648831.p1  ORF type:complete len:633 (-),score=157.60 NODE_3326_length_2052_cov_9.648831:152-1828(-)
MVFLSLGPTAIIMFYFWRRYHTSTLKLQVVYTFLEAIGWMLPLMVAIFLFDPLNRRIMGRSMEHTCTWHDNHGGKAFVNVLSYSAHCTRSGFSLTGDWDGLECPVTNDDGMDGNEAQPLGLSGYKYTKIPTSLIVYLVNKVSEAGSTPGCDGLEEALEDALTDKAEIAFISRGETWVEGKDYADAFDLLYNRSAHARSKVAGGCVCAKQVHDGLVPSYDFCGSGGRCKVADPENCGREEGWCSAGSALDVSVTFKYQQNTVLHAIVNAYFRAAFLEELLKYLAVRRILFKNRVADCGGLVVYGLAAAAGFATAENVQYTLMHGVMVAYGRMVLAIPLHCLTGLIIGIHLGYRKFVGVKHIWLSHWYIALIPPVIIHGTYDVFLMLPKFVPIPQLWRIIIVAFVLVLGVIYCRKMWLGLENVCVVDVHKLEASGRIKPGKCCCCERDSIKQYRTHDDNMVAGSMRRKARGLLAPGQGGAEHEDEDDSDEEPTNNFVAIAAELVPPAPITCQTKRSTCPKCKQAVRVQLFYPSTCPYCAFNNPDPRPPAGMSVHDMDSIA